MADENKHFFKLMVGDFTESLSIPDRFANNFNGHISEDVNLKSPSGKTWSIGVANDTDGVVLRSGWNEFVSAHSIEEGDYLLFKYSGVSSFDVLMFDPNGCEKTSPHFVKNHGYERLENSAGVEGVRCGCRYFERTQDRTPQSPPISNDNAHLEMTLHRSTGKSISRACKRDLYYDIEQAHCEVKDDEDLELDDRDAPAKVGYYFCKNGPVSEYHLTEQDKEEISSIRVPLQPRNPVFVQVMHPSHVRGKSSSVVGVSSEFAGKYLVTIGKEIILQRASRRGTWHVHYASRDYCRGLCGRGWCDFARDNGLVNHDVCLFELIKGKRRPTMAVHVLRRLRGRFALLR